MDRLLNYDFSALLPNLQEIVQDPASNLTGAVLLVAIVSLTLLMGLVVAIFFIASADDDEEEETVAAAGAPIPAATAVAQNKATTPVERGPHAGLLALATWTVVLMLAWVAGGYVTSGNAMCESCHPNHPHAKAKKADPHAGTDCVSCHETGGHVARVTYLSAPRGVHFVLGILKMDTVDGYGSVTSAQCQTCHEAQIAVVSRNDKQGVRMSHKEPVEAGAQCVECHALSSGIVTNNTVGMTPCLRCHDGTAAKSECATCHTADVGIAARPRQPSVARHAKDLIGQPDCGGCHSQKSCDACHGIRMPHTVDFMGHGHARAAVEDLWYNGGRTCRKCHNDQRRPCGKCHSPMPSHPVSDWPKTHQNGNDGRCGSCHGQRAWMYGRSFCGLCHE